MAYVEQVKGAVAEHDTLTAGFRGVEELGQGRVIEDDSSRGGWVAHVVSSSWGGEVSSWLMTKFA